MPRDPQNVYPGECLQCGKRVADDELDLNEVDICWECEESMEFEEDEDSDPDAFFKAAFSIANAPYEEMPDV